MSDKFIPLECDDDIIQISNDSFTVKRLRQLVIKAVREKPHQGNIYQYLYRCLHQLFQKVKTL